MIPVFMGKTLAEPKYDPPNSPIASAIKQDGNHIVLLACNRSMQPVQATLRSPQIRAGQIDVFKENRQVKSGVGALTDHFDPLEVHVYDLAH
jgi:hypothetical protein